MPLRGRRADDRGPMGSALLSLLAAVALTGLAVYLGGLLHEATRLG